MWLNTVNKPYRVKRNILALVLTFAFLWVLSRGFVVSGDDWFFSSRTMDENLLEALKAGYRVAAEHYISTNGRLIGNALSALFGCSDLWREIIRCTIILTILVLLCHVGKVRSMTMYAVVVLLTIALPADIYRQSYAWAAGFFNYVPPLVLILGYFFLSEIQEGHKGLPFAFGMFLLGLCTQLFVENITLGMCLLSLGVLVWEHHTSRRWSVPLLMHLIGCICGCAVMFLAPGYSNVNVEGYREVSTSLDELVNVIQTNFFAISLYLTERNWPIIVPLTGLSLSLILQEKQVAGVRRYVKYGVVFCLMLCPAWFYAHNKILRVMSYAKWVKNLCFAADVTANLVYLVSILMVAVICLRERVMKRRAVLCVAAFLLVLLPLTVVNPIGPRCMYVPYMLFVCMILLFAQELNERKLFTIGRCLRIPVLAVAAGVLTAYLWISVWNGHYEQIRVGLIAQAMEQHASEVVLPNYPYMDYIHGPNGDGMYAYYYYRNPGDFRATFVSNKEWYLNQ